MDKWIIRQPAVMAKADEIPVISSEPGKPSISGTVEKCVKKRKYQEAYLAYGFTYCIIDGEQRPQCLLCSEILANDSLKPVKLKRHLYTKHTEYTSKSIEFFERKLKGLGQQKLFIEKHSTVPKKLLKASYEASYLIAKAKQPHTIGETLIMPVAIKVTEIIHGKKLANELKTIPLSNDTVSKRIREISGDLLQQLLDRMRKSPKFAIQLDESTDISNFAQLLTYVRYCFENHVHEDLLFCQQLEGRTTGDDIFIKLNDFFIANDLSWNNCVGVCTDGAAAMTGKKKGLIAQIKNLGNTTEVSYTHCIIHREALAAKKMSPELNKILQEVITVVNFIKSRALNSRLFSQLCKAMGSDHDKLLLHAEVRWLSRGRVLRRLVELKDEVKLFLIQANATLAEFFHNEKWLCILSYLADIFEKLNDLNTSLQGKNTNILTLHDKITAFLKKIAIWKNKIKNENIDMFPWTSDFIEENDLDLAIIKDVVLGHLTSMETHFESYFSSDWDVTKHDWIREPFNLHLEKIQHLSLTAQEELAELSSDRSLQIEFKNQEINNFWLTVKNEFPVVSNMAINVLLPFATSYLCESAFSALTYIKSKYRTRLVDVEADLRPTLSEIQPRFDLLCSKMQAHPSH